MVNATGDTDRPQEANATGSTREAAAARFEFEKQAEERKTQLEEKKLKQARFDTWARFAGTVALGVLVTGGIQWYGIRAEGEAKARAVIAEDARNTRELAAEEARNTRQLAAQQTQKTIERHKQQAEMVIQLTNAREKALSDLRARMFDSLIQHYFQLGSEAERIAILQLIGLNFRDAVQIKPMFELLDWQFANGDLSSEQKGPARKALRGAARSIIRDQLSQIRQSTDGVVCQLELNVSDTKNPECFPTLTVELVEVEESKIRVRTNTRGGAFLETPDEAHEGWDDFTVTYFDMPMVDYTAATRQTDLEPIRYSIVLSETGQKTARIAVAVLPLSAVNSQHRYAFDELLQDYLFPADAE